MPETTPKVLAGWVINVALPAMALRDIHKVSIDGSWVMAAASPWITIGLAMVLLLPVIRWTSWSTQRVGALLLVAGWGNTSFVGLPMISAYFGSEWLALGLFIDLFGSYLALSTLGIGIATFCSSKHFDWRVMVRRIVTFPPFIAIMAALATNHLDRPDWVEVILEMLGATLTPLALAAVGFAIRIDKLRYRVFPLAVGLTYRLVLAPLAIALLYTAFGQIRDPVAQVAIFEAAMPPMLGASMIAIEHELEPDLVALMIGIGIPLSMATAPVWKLLLTSF